MGSSTSFHINFFLGVLSGYFGGKLDMVLQRLVDARMSFPDLVVVIVAVSVLGPGKIQIIFILSLLYGIAGSRIIRGAVMGVRENDYVKAADSIGVSTTMIMMRHIIPNILAPVSVLFTTRLAATILVEAALSF